MLRLFVILIEYRMLVENFKFTLGFISTTNRDVQMRENFRILFISILVLQFKTLNFYKIQHCLYQMLAYIVHLFKINQPHLNIRNEPYIKIKTNTRFGRFFRISNVWAGYQFIKMILDCFKYKLLKSPIYLMKRIISMQVKFLH